MVAWVLVQVRGLVPQYRAAGVPLIAHVEQTGRTLRVVSGKAKADGGFEPCTLAALVLTGLENDNGNPVNQALNLTMYAHGGLSINPEGLYAIGRRYEESVV
ncbi:hypothetical protein HYU15_03560 [Candidatus Woesearchaeota archaeon]|nr:hypothetical protein [Candidatus Woesearchaeota archaeon]